MDPIANPSTFIVAIDSPVSSLVSSFVQLNMNRRTDGPINLLPNEIMQMIMAKLGLDRDVKKLIRLRLVSTRWRAIIEDYCRMKKSLIVVMGQNAYTYIDVSQFEKRFFGFANLNHFARLFLSTEIPSEYLKSMLLNLFPNIVQLSIDCGSDYICDMVEYINSLDSLKQLDLVGSFHLGLPKLFTTLSKLDHFSFDIAKFQDDDRLELLISHLGCVRVNFGFGSLFYDQVCQLHSVNAHLFTNLTHLRINIQSTSEDCGRVVHLLCEHATSLQTLNFASLGESLIMTPTVIKDLGKLSHLIHLELWWIEMNISDLEQHRITSLSSVLAVKLCLYDGRSDSGDQFTRVLSTILPNLVDLELRLCLRFANAPSGLDFEQYSYRFENLHKIGVHTQWHFVSNLQSNNSSESIFCLILHKLFE